MRHSGRVAFVLGVALVALAACGAEKGGLPVAMDAGVTSFGPGQPSMSPEDSVALEPDAHEAPSDASGGPDAPDGTSGGDVPVVPEACWDDGDCEDGNPCTLDRCKDGSCQNLTFAAPCDDGNPCTVDDHCDAGACKGTPMDCDDLSACTEDSCHAGACVHDPLVHDPQCKVDVAITWPARAAILTGSNKVDVKGQIGLGAGTITAATLNGAPLEVAVGGAFAAEIEARSGLNILVVEVEGSLGQRDRAVQSFAWGDDTYTPGAPGAVTEIDGGTGIWLDRTVFDDDDTGDVDDLATIAWHVLKSYDVNAAIPHPLFADAEAPSFGWCTWEVDLSNVSYKVGAMDIDPVPGGISLVGKLHDLSAHVSAVASWCPDAIGEVSAGTVTIAAQMSVTVGDSGKVLVQVDSVDVTVSDVEVDIQKGAASLFNWLINWFEDDLAAKLEEQLESWIPANVAPMIQKILGSFTSYETTFQVPAFLSTTAPLPLTLKVRATDAAFGYDGAALLLTAGAAAKKAITHSAPGSLVRGACDSAPPPPVVVDACDGACGGESEQGCWCDDQCLTFGDCCDDVCATCGVSCQATLCAGFCGEKAESGCYCDAECAGFGDCCADACATCGFCGGADIDSPLDQSAQLEAFVLEDLANQALFALWWGGGLSATLTDADLGGQAAKLGMSDVVLVLDPLMAPIATTCTPSGALELQLGDMRIEAEFKLLGIAAVVKGYASVRARVELGLEKQGATNALRVSLAGVEQIAVEISEVEGLGPDGPDLVESLIKDGLLDMLVEQVVSGAVGAWPIPEIAPGQWVPGVPAGATITANPTSLELGPGWVLVKGKVAGP